MPTCKTDRLSLTPYQIVPAVPPLPGYQIENQTERYPYRYPTLAAARAAVADFLRQDLEEDELALAAAEEDGTAELIDLRERIREVLDTTREYVDQETDLAVLRAVLASLSDE